MQIHINVDNIIEINKIKLSHNEKSRAMYTLVFYHTNNNTTFTK